ncbi:hypothetical protein [Actinomycetospora sp.]|uniref:hypothetical protein n=1 Tax=Actinomycetospora sp. TaxID=1872135 RepID=UPI002F3FE8DC
MTVLLDPTTPRPDSAVPAARLDPDTLTLPPVGSATSTAAVVPEAPAPGDHAPELPDDLAPLVSRARRDRGSALALVHLLLERGWSATTVGATLAGQVGLTRTQIEALATVRRPRTSASDVADRLVAARHPLARVPHPRRS